MIRFKCKKKIENIIIFDTIRHHRYERIQRVISFAAWIDIDLLNNAFSLHKFQEICSSIRGSLEIEK
jgi:hypothetical protein